MIKALAAAASIGLAGLSGVAALAQAERPATAPAADAAMTTAVNGDWRTPEQRARDRWRHPVESLSFWGLRPGSTIVEIEPGGAWWTQILAPYAAATGGRYIGVLPSSGTPETAERAAAARQRFASTLSAPRYGQVAVVSLTPAGIDAPAGSADVVLVARAFHNWARVEGRTDAYMRAFFTVLKPGGVLAVEQHRLPAGQAARPESGYVSEQYVIEAAQRAGFVLEARSEINANPADTTVHPFGVWTLPPVRQSAPDNQPDNAAFDHTPYDRIGESDRMTLRFRKPR